MPFPRVENIREYTLDMEQWLIAEIIYEPSSYSKIRRIVSPGHFGLVHNSVFLQAIENLFIAHGTEGIHPVGIAHEVVRLSTSWKPAVLSFQEAAAYLRTYLDFPPLSGGSLEWAAREIKRLAQERGVNIGTAYAKRKIVPV